MEPSGRLAFADVLRGIASLIVAVGHLTILYLTAPALVASVTAGAPRPAVVFPPWLDTVVSTINLPSTGVAIFFLISGFVIPLSLETSALRGYVLKRLFRIYPTLWLALMVAAAAIFLSSRFWGTTPSLEIADYAANAGLMANMFTRYDVLMVAWTLQIEIKFYIVAILISYILRKRTAVPLILCAIAIVGLFWLATNGCDNSRIACWDHYRITSKRLLFEGMFITYMTIGSLFYAHYQRLIPAWQAVAGSLVLFACFELALNWSPLPMLNEGNHLPYTWGLAIFTGCYLARGRIRLVQPFRFLADISYPLYLLHPIAGYVGIRLLEAAGLPFPLAFALVLTSVIALASLVHVYVEAPAIAFSKRLARSWDAPGGFRQRKALGTAAGSS